MGSSALGVVGVLVSVIGIPLTWFLTRHSRRSPDFRYALEFDVLMTKRDGIPDSGLRIATSSHEVSRVSRTRLAIWNARGDTVRRGDIVASDPLRLEFRGEDHPLNVRYVSQSREQIDLGVTVAPGAGDRDYHLNIEFDFLDAGDGGVLEVLHEGTEALSLAGTIRGVRIREVRGAKIASRLRSVAAASAKPSRRWWAFVDVESWLIAIVVALTVFIVLEDLRPLVRKAILVPVDQFDLTTIVGQMRFADQVSVIGGVHMDYFYSYVLVVAGIALLGGMTIGRRRVRIPRSIVRTGAYFDV